MARAREYRETLIISKSKVTDAIYAQNNIIREGFENADRESLISVLSSVAGVLALVFIQYSAVGVATGVFGVIASLEPLESSALKGVLQNGTSDLLTIHEWFSENSQYDLIKIEMGFIEYPDENIRFVTHTDVNYIKAVHTDGGWIQV